MKHTKAVGVALAAGVLSLAFAPVGSALNTKADTIDLANECFVEFVLSDTEYEGELVYTHAPLYNEDLEVSGREYTFSVGEVQGYALLAEIPYINEICYEVEELFYHKASPFAECGGTPVYITHGVYLEYSDGEFYNIADGSLVSQAAVEEYAYEGFGYCGDGSTTAVTQTVAYTTKETTTYSIEYDLPNYKGSVNGVTGCANTAGGIVIGYYDRFCENLIPDYQSYMTIGGGLCYKTNTTEALNMILELYTLMGTDVGVTGTTFTGFQNGMQQYVTGKGYTYTTESMFTNGVFNMSSYRTAVQSGKPVVIFMSGFAMLAQTTTEDNVDTINSNYINDTHVTVGCGYKTDTYYNSLGWTINIKQYLKVASGLEEYNIGYLNINALGTMDSAISVQIS